MTQQIVLSGIGARQQGEAVRRTLIRMQPRAVGIAAAFVSVAGVQELLETLRWCDRPKCRLVAGTDNAITHPQALSLARDEGWGVRLGRPMKARGIFHPKLLVAGKKFSSIGEIEELSCIYVGSSNLTMGGLRTNVECGLMAEADGCLKSALCANVRETGTPREISVEGGEEG